MNKQNRSGMGGAPTPEKAEFVGGSPINSAVPQGGFTREKGGNLRDHNGMKANRAAIMATEHYDGDYGTAPIVPVGGGMGGNSQSIGGNSQALGGGAGNSQSIGGGAPTRPISEPFGGRGRLR